MERGQSCDKEKLLPAILLTPSGGSGLDKVVERLEVSLVLGLWMYVSNAFGWIVSKDPEQNNASLLLFL